MYLLKTDRWYLERVMFMMAGATFLLHNPARYCKILH